MLDKSFANRFAADWIASWNTHDLEGILTHYTDDFEMSSPVIPLLAGEPSGVLKGKAALRAYWAKALQRAPNLHFELITTLAGVNSVTLYYKGGRGLSAEVFHFDQHGKVTRAYAHYAETVAQALRQELLEFDVGRLDHFRVSQHLCPDHRGKLRWRGDKGIGALAGQPFPHVGHGENLRQLGRQFVDNRLGGACGHRHAVPVADIEIRHAGFSESWQLRQRRQTRFTGDGHGFDPTAFYRANQVDRHIQVQLHMTAEKFGEGRPAAFVWHVLQFGAGKLAEYFHAQMALSAAAGRGVAQESGLGLCVGDQFLRADATIDPENMPDLLHFSQKGYAMWAAAIKPELDCSLAANHPQPAPTTAHPYLNVHHLRRPQSGLKSIRRE